MIERLVVKNFKALRDTDIEFKTGFNVLVGDNECGKSTVLEAINLCLTGQLQKRPAAYELHPFLFNLGATQDFLNAVLAGEKPDAPEILIELYLSNTAPADYRGTHNSLGLDRSGISLRICLDDACAEQYASFLDQKDRVSLIPTEFYHVDWTRFDGNMVNPRAQPVKSVLIDPSAIRDTHGANRYVVDTARDVLTKKQQAEISVSYRYMRHLFQDDENVKAINSKLKERVAEITQRDISVGLDMTARGNWDSNVLPHIDQVPLSQIGKGEQNAIKIKLAMVAGEEIPIVLLEEPENHLSHSKLSALIDAVVAGLGERQLIAATHSSFVLNKFGVDRTLLFNGSNATRINELSPGTRDYFLKLPGHDTLRMVLARRTILVEGPSDELFVQRAYAQVHGKSPLEDGVEIITVNSLAFKRFLEIAEKLKLDVAVVTDNDGDVDAVRKKYEAYDAVPSVRICFDQGDEGLKTLEPQIHAVNGREKLNRILNKNFATDDELLAFMENNKTSVALQLFEANEVLDIPKYISDAVA
ncbi:ATP-dependent nuclease [Primorskyibacter sp. S187A]|uniref:ATP-dependent nuclease n=1 Tax=Primorskyibacter sp. S187A TaxID=3415130 RepID=UPI003C7B435D